MRSAFLQYGASCIHYLQYGSGPVYIVALHGYGETSASFLCLEEYLREDYCVIAIDLPFHGKSTWLENRVFTCDDFIKILSAVFKAMEIPGTDFILLGYSIGGRLALSIAENLPEKISRIVLLAPDGMKVNFWYWLATQTRAGNQLFLYTMKKPAWLFRLLRIADRFKLINKSIYKFMLNYIDDSKGRLELFHRWTCMRAFKPDLEEIRSLIRQKKFSVRLLYGKYDRIIVSKRARHFYHDLEPLCQLYIIDAGHNILQKKYADIIVNLLTV